MNISLIEFLVYGGITYFSLAMLIITTIRNPTEKTRRLALVRAGYMFPGIICAIILAGSGVSIYLGDSTTTTSNTAIYEVLDNTNAVVTLNSTVTETVAVSAEYVLQNPIWVMFHYMLALVMISFVFIQVLTMFTAKD